MTETTLTETPDLPVPDGITWIGDWYMFGPEGHPSTAPARNFAIDDMVLSLCGFTWITTLRVCGVQHHDGEIVSFIEIPEDLIADDGALPEAIRDLLDDGHTMLSPAEAEGLAHHLERIAQAGQLCCSVCVDDFWILLKALHYAARYLRDFGDVNGMAPHDEELT
jgi:hypothetical protein